MSQLIKIDEEYAEWIQSVGAGKSSNESESGNAAFLLAFGKRYG